MKYITQNPLLIEIENQSQKLNDLESYHLIVLPSLHSHAIVAYPDMG